MFLGDGDRAGSGVDAEFVVDPAQVGFDGGLADEQGAGDVAVAEALGELAQDVAFAVGEGGQGARIRAMTRLATGGDRVVRPWAAERIAAKSSSGRSAFSR